MKKTGTLVKTALTLMACGMLAAPITADAGRFRGAGGGGGGGLGLGTGDGIRAGGGNGNGQGLGFVDEDGDGFNDNALRAGFGDGDGTGAGMSENYVDSNDDGLCDISGLAPGTGDGTGYRGGR